MLNNQQIARVKAIIGGKDRSLSEVFSALSDPTRCHIFRSLVTQQELCVSDMTKIMEISMSSASQHLKILETNDLLAKERRGRAIYYSLNRSNPIVNAIVKVLE